MALSPDDLPSDISPSLRAALTEYFEETGVIPPCRRWPILFGPDRESQEPNQWMLM